MLLTEVPNYIKCSKIYKLDKKNINFKYIFTNSKNIIKNSILVIKDKKKFKKEFIKEAINQGAIAIITKEYINNIKLTQFIVSNIDQTIFNLTNTLRSVKPKNSLAITGTNGKTTVAWYLSQICKYNKIENKMYGTLGYYVNFKKKKSSFLTTPQYEVLQQTAFLNNANKYNYIFEASSHALDQNRIKNFPINIAAITNLSQDHLDYHNDFHSYKKCKLKLFKNYLDKNGYAILNDKIKGISLFKKCLNNNQVITYGTAKSNINLELSKTGIKLKFFNKKYFIKDVNFSQIEIENLTCTIACCFSLKINIKNILKTISKLKNPPGRLEKLQKYNGIYKIFIDYAHTPDALKKVLISQTINKKKPNVVFGCGGERDKDKRIKMGKIANQYAEKVYVTDDNPRKENPAKIREAILLNCKKGIEISNRKKAIIKAIQDLKKYQILIIAGKGHENIQIKKDTTIFFNDLKIAKQELRKKN